MYMSYLTEDDKIQSNGLFYSNNNRLSVSEEGLREFEVLSESKSRKSLLLSSHKTHIYTHTDRAKERERKENVSFKLTSWLIWAR